MEPAIAVKEFRAQDRGGDARSFEQADHHDHGDDCTIPGWTVAVDSAPDCMDHVRGKLGPDWHRDKRRSWNQEQGPSCVDRAVAHSIGIDQEADGDHRCIESVAGLEVL